MKVDSLTPVAEYARKRFADLACAYREDEAFSVRLPADDGLVLLIEEAFWASISRDEGRACRFTIVYYRDEPGRGNPDITIALDPRPFGRDLLRRLAAVAFAADAKIAVSTVNGQLRIIGLSKHLLLTSEIADRAGLPIEIEVVGPGHMAIRHGIFRVLTYRGGSLPDPAPNILHAVGPFRKALDKLAVAEGIPGADWQSPASSFLYLCSARSPPKGEPCARRRRYSSHGDALRRPWRSSPSGNRTR